MPRSPWPGIHRCVPRGNRRRRPGALRERFTRKALTARQGRVCQALMADGLDPDAIAALTVAELPEGLEADRCVEAPAGAWPASRPVLARADCR